MFVEYTESNSLILLAAISKVEKSRGRQNWASLMKIMADKKATDVETLILGMTVINKTLNGIPDQDTFFDVVDTLESLELDESIKSMLQMQDSQLTQQCQHYEHELRKEDAASGVEDEDGQVVKMRINGNSTTTVFPVRQTFVEKPIQQQNGFNNIRYRMSILLCKRNILTFLKYMPNLVQMA